MSLITFRQAKALSEDGDLDGLIMAAMLKADLRSLIKLNAAFPEIWQELSARIGTRDGCLNQHEVEHLKEIQA